MPVEKWMLRQHNPAEDRAEMLGNVANTFQQEVYAPTMRAREQMYATREEQKLMDEVRGQPATDAQKAFAKNYGYNIKTRGDFDDFIKMSQYEAGNMRLMASMYGGAGNRPKTWEEYAKEANKMATDYLSKTLGNKMDVATTKVKLQPMMFAESLYTLVEKPEKNLPALTLFKNNQAQVVSAYLQKKQEEGKNANEQELMELLIAHAQQFPDMYNKERAKPELAQVLGRLPEKWEDMSNPGLGGQDGVTAYNYQQSLASIGKTEGIFFKGFPKLLSRIYTGTRISPE